MSHRPKRKTQHHKKKLLGQNTGIYLCDIEVGKDFLQRSQKALNANLKIGELDLIKIQIFCSYEDTFKKMKWGEMKRQTTN